MKCLLLTAALAATTLVLACRRPDEARPAQFERDGLRVVVEPFDAAATETHDAFARRLTNEHGDLDVIVADERPALSAHVRRCIINAERGRQLPEPRGRQRVERCVEIEPSIGRLAAIRATRALVSQVEHLRSPTRTGAEPQSEPVVAHRLSRVASVGVGSVRAPRMRRGVPRRLVQGVPDSRHSHSRRPAHRRRRLRTRTRRGGKRSVRRGCAPRGRRCRARQRGRQARTR